MGTSERHLHFISTVPCSVWAGGIRASALMSPARGPGATVTTATPPAALPPRALQAGRVQLPTDHPTQELCSAGAHSLWFPTGNF